MQAMSRFGLAVILATLLIWNASALCAAPFAPVQRSAHPCCPTHESSHGDAAAHCCLARGGPIPPAAVSSPGNASWTTSRLDGTAASPLPEAAPVGVTRPLPLSFPLSLQFHQLLI